MTSRVIRFKPPVKFLDSVYLAQALGQKFPDVDRRRIEDIAEAVVVLLPECLTDTPERATLAQQLREAIKQ